MKNKIILLIVVLLVFGGGFLLLKNQTPNNSSKEVNSSETITNINLDNEKAKVAPKSMETNFNIDLNKNYQATLKTTAGDITIEFSKKTPKTTANFISLAKKGFYDNTVFHRVIKDFMIQGGDPTGTGSGGPGYSFEDEPFEGEYTQGTVAMANAGPNTNGSQFFIMHGDVPLPKNYVIFGKVISGLEVVAKIATAPVETSPTGEVSKPVNPVKITSVEIIEK